MRTRLRRRAGRSLSSQFLEPVLVVVVHAAKLAFELLIAELQLLDNAGELSDLCLQTIQAHDHVGSCHLSGTLGGRPFASACLLPCVRCR